MLMFFQDGQQDTFPFWENIVLIEADSYELASIIAEEKGRWYEAHSDDILIDDRPAKFKFAGIRKIITCGYGGESPHSGIELTFSSFLVQTQDGFDKFVAGESTEIIIRSEWAEDD